MIGGIIKTPILHVWYGRLNPGITNWTFKKFNFVKTKMWYAFG